MPGLTRFAFLSALALAACSEATAPPTSAARAAGPECGGPDQPTCQFFDGPFQLARQPVRVPTRPAPFYPLARPLGFVDSGNSRWQAPRGTLTDGASIPPIFVSVIGSPRSPEFAQGAAMHDAYCGVGNDALETFHGADWRAVHRMLYDGLRVGGTDEVRAKIMFAAVWLGGPRWGNKGRDLSRAGVLHLSFAESGGAATDQPGLEGVLKDRVAPYLSDTPAAGLGFREGGRYGGVSYDAYERDLSGVPVWAMRRLLRNAARYIQTTKPTPSIDEIIIYLERQEVRMLRRLYVEDSDRQPTFGRDDDIGEEPEEEEIIVDPEGEGGEQPVVLPEVPGGEVGVVD